MACLNNTTLDINYTIMSPSSAYNFLSDTTILELMVASRTNFEHDTYHLYSC